MVERPNLNEVCSYSNRPTPAVADIPYAVCIGYKLSQLLEHFQCFTLGDKVNVH